MLTGGQVADCTAASLLLERLPPCRILHGDKGYDTNAIRNQIEQHGAMPNIPPKASRRWKTLLLARPLPRPQRHRAHVLPPQGLPPRRHPL
jgi:IS5 family transposase